MSVSVYKEMAKVRVGARVYLPILTRHIFRLILPTPDSRAIVSPGVSGVSACTEDDDGDDTYTPQHVRIFVFGWDHVWIKWQHGSPADADIFALCAAQTLIHRSLRSSWAHGRIHSSYIRIPASIPVHAFLHHRAVTYAAEIAKV